MKTKKDLFSIIYAAIPYNVNNNVLSDEERETIAEAVVSELKKPKQNDSVIFTVISRILGLPFFVIGSLIGVLILWAKYMTNFIRFGGEAISYTQKMQRKCIVDVYNKLQEMQNKECCHYYPATKSGYLPCEFCGTPHPKYPVKERIKK
jgi:hypothetical protein